MNFYKFLKAKKYFQAVIFILLFFVLSFSLTACFNNNNNKKQTKPITKINQKNSQKQATTTSSTTDQTIEQENQSNYILKKVGTDKNGWNIYRSRKYGFEFKAPAEIMDIKTYNNGITYNIYFKKFFITIVNNYKYDRKLTLVDNFLNYKCSLRSDKADCLNKTKQQINKKNIIHINSINTIKTIDMIGINDFALFYYIFKNDFIFIAKLPIQDVNNITQHQEGEIENILKTFKIIK